MEEIKNTAAPADSEQVLVRRQKLADLRAAGCDPFTITKFPQDAYSADLKAEYASLPNEADAGRTAALAGRMMSKRVMGKASFAHLRDDKGDIQLYVRRDELGEEAYAAFKKLDVGDIIGVKGEVFRTKTGELSLRVTELTLLAKSLRPLPEKFHGLTDTEMRYRQRYVDLIANPEVKDTFVKRSRILKEIRAYLDEKGFLEVDTPILTPFEIGASARPFITHHNTLNMDMVLRIETELYLKRLVVGGMDRVYEVGRIFRNEGMDPKHNPEFTSIELYQAFTDYHGMMDLVEELYKRLAEKICGSLVIPYQGKQIDMGHWERLTMVEAVKKYSGVDYHDWKTDSDAITAAKAHNVDLPEVPTRGSILAAFFDAFVEDKLIQPTFIYDYPVEISPLAKRKPDDPAFTERFEYFIDCTEYGNAFSELNDPIDQKDRFERQVAERKALEPGCKAQVDYDYVNALEYGLPPTGGLGFGVDRLVMLLTDSASIRDVLLFPTMKPLDGPAAAKQEEAPAAAPAQQDAPAAEAAPAPAAVEPIDFSNVEIEPLFEDMVDFETFSKSDFRAVKIKACSAVPKSKKLLQFVLDDGSGTDRVILSGIHAYYEPEELVGKTAIAIVNLPPRKMMGIDSCGMLISAVHHELGAEKLHLLMVDDHIPAGAKLY
ncbi:MAG TPA: lysine--tRNA ligase [Candidatus Faecalibacterium faecigallinarum]|uniref:Lysine--tRNA ligase n=1 Tax=Candidatus Faecalibacterium faecigallinarum TaxID=2838577 RepID=A0A9D2P7E4_9FIRM|nr:lysine--tRNA ligase [Candidatus Faecalibacterium faecigallinarum]